MAGVVVALAVATAALLGWTGMAKLLGRTSVDGLAALLGSSRRARPVMRMVGMAELGVAVLLVVVPRFGGVAATALGVGFLGYLVAAGRVAPGSSCGCAGSSSPVTWRTYARASAVTCSGVVIGWLGGSLLPVAGSPFMSGGSLLPVGAASPSASGSLLSDVAASPYASGGLLLLALLGYAVLSPELDRGWLRPLRQLRVHLFGHPLALSGGPVPVAASVELLETSLAWQSTAHLVRSSLLEHWAADGWRVLRYAGRHDTETGARPVTILFAVDARATTSVPRGTAVRVTVVDDETGDVLPEPPLRVPRIRPLPVA